MRTRIQLLEKGYAESLSCQTGVICSRFIAVSSAAPELINLSFVPLRMPHIARFPSSLFQNSPSLITPVSTVFRDRSTVAAGVPGAELNQGAVALTQLAAKETAPLAPFRVPMRPSP
jgi:hypothetical protein